MKIIEFRAENVQRLIVVQITPEGHLVQITGGNAQGKTSVLDSIWMALGGKDAIPEQPIHEGKKSARIEVKLGDRDGLKLVVERTFTEKGTYLTVKSPDGGKFAKPQQMMDEMMGAIGFDPLQFMRMDAKQQFAMLRGIVKLDVDIDALDRKRLTIYEARTALGRSVASAKARAEAITVPDDLPEDLPDIQAITDRLTGASATNAEIDRMEREEQSAREKVARFAASVEEAEYALVSFREDLEVAQAAHKLLAERVLPARVDATAVRAELDAANAIAEGIRRRQTKIDADAELTTLTREQEEKTAEIGAIDAAKTKAITQAKMPVDGLAFFVPEGESFTAGTVTYKGHPLKQASGAEQLAVSAAIGAALNPKLRVLLCRDGSLLDSKSLKALGDFATANDMQVFLERVDESGEIGVVIEDGHVKGQEELVAEFIKSEQQQKPENPAEAGAAPANVTDPERIKRAQAFVAAELAKLPTYTMVKECDKANASVKFLLSAFPDIFAAEWTPAYLERVKVLSKKK